MVELVKGLFFIFFMVVQILWYVYTEISLKISVTWEKFVVVIVTALGLSTQTINHRTNQKVLIQHFLSSHCKNLWFLLKTY